MKRSIRIVLAALVFLSCIGIFLDFTGTLQAWLGWVAQIQLIPSILALNFGIFALLCLLTFVFGRLYCSVICPLGIFQDIFSAFRRKKSRYKFWPDSKKRHIVRYSILAVFIGLLAVGMASTAAVIDPYSAFGRMASSLFSPLYDWGNNFLADIAQKHESYALYSVDVWIRGLGSFVLAAITFVGLAIAGVMTGRGYCTTICPVGTFLGLISRFAIFRVRIDPQKCIQCGACSARCKSHCIDLDAKRIDSSHCVDCMNCLGGCKKDAIHYGPSLQELVQKKAGSKSDVAQTEIKENEVKTAPKDVEPDPKAAETPANERRAFLTAAAATASVLVCPAVANAGGDGNLSNVSRKSPYPRENRIVPPGARSILHFNRHCTGCMLCVRACHNKVLRTACDSNGILRPVLSYEYGYCRPTCNDCSQVCPTDAIQKITLEEKSSIQIGRAVWVRTECLSAKGVHCRACSRACPAGAISMTATTFEDGKKAKIPLIDTERCIGCGACEYVCPARPLAAIHVDGNIQHREI